jgi:hypothetical protein
MELGGKTFVPHVCHLRGKFASFTLFTPPFKQGPYHHQHKAGTEPYPQPPPVHEDLRTQRRSFVDLAPPPRTGRAKESVGSGEVSSGGAAATGFGVAP